MTHATTHNTNTPRRVHPAVVRAALRSRNTHRFEYDRLDRMVKEIRPLGQTISYAYDAKQLRQIGESVNYGGFTLATSTTWNALGQKTAVTYPDGATYTYTYDANNQLSTVGLPTGYGSITINSYLWTVPSQITLPGGTVRTQQYDGLLRLKNLGVKDPGQSQVMNYQYGYGLTGNIVTKATEAGNTTYSYDTLDRLTGAAYTGQATAQANETYTYDPVANRITGSNAHVQGASYTYNANNQLTQAGSITYTYDENGNTTKQTDANNAANTRSYVYDTDNRLIEVHDANNAIVAVYSYDPFGRRLSKDTGNSKTYYFYNAEGLIAEADATGQITRSYGYAPNSTFGTNPLFTKVGNAYYTYQNDHLGTPMKLLNQGGVTVWSATYDAFGNATIAPNSTITNNLRFPGQYADAETNLHYNWNRYYDPQTGRYVTSDPIGLKGGINTYTYVKGSPVRLTDPTGELGFVGAGIGAGIEIGMQAHRNYRNGCDMFRLSNYDFGDIGIAMLVGAVGPGWFSVGKTIGKSGGALGTLYGQVGRTANRARKIDQRIAKNYDEITDALIWQSGFQGAKTIGKHMNGNGGCQCQK